MSGFNRPARRSIMMIVLMPMYNAEPFIVETLDSFVRASHDFDGQVHLIIRDDGSQDSSAALATAYMQNHSNIMLVKNRHNIGLLGTREQLFLDAHDVLSAQPPDKSDEHLLMLFDADDIFKHDIFSLQQAYLQDRPHLSACGGQPLLFKDDITKTRKFLGCSPDFKQGFEAIKVESLFQGAFIIGGLTIRYRFIRDRLSYGATHVWASHRIGEDWSWFVENMAQPDFHLENNPAVVYYYRRHQSNMTLQIHDGIASEQAGIRLRAFAHIDLQPTEHEHLLHICISPSRHWQIEDLDFFRMHRNTLLKDAEKWLDKILACNQIRPFYDARLLQDYCDMILENLVDKLSQADPGTRSHA